MGRSQGACLTVGKLVNPDTKNFGVRVKLF